MVDMDFKYGPKELSRTICKYGPWDTCSCLMSVLYGSTYVVLNIGQSYYGVDHSPLNNWTINYRISFWSSAEIRDENRVYPFGDMSCSRLGVVPWQSFTEAIHPNHAFVICQEFHNIQCNSRHTVCTLEYNRVKREKNSRRKRMPQSYSPYLWTSYGAKIDPC